MTELQPPDAPVNGGILGGAPPLPPPPPSSADIPNLTTKRQRRPSVRLGEIGDHKPLSLSYEPYKRPTTTTTTNRLWSSDSKFHHNHYFPSTTTTTTTIGTAGIKSSKTRTITNFSNNGVNIQETLQTEEKKNSSKAKRGGTKRVRSNWVPKIDQGAAAIAPEEEIPEKFSEDENWYKGFDDVVDDSDPSPNQSREDNMLLHMSRPRVSDHGGAVELDTDLKDWNNGVSEDRGKEMEGLEDGVRMWLKGLGLRRYEPVFEVHEVDEEVLPLLTLDDLKDMGINAVGSRRKLYCAIQKLGKGFS